MTDGDFLDNNAVPKNVGSSRLNADRKVKINKIAFVDKSDTESEFIELLKQIAKDNGGIYKPCEEELELDWIDGGDR